MHASRRTQWTSAFALLLCILPGLPVQVLCDRRVSCPNDSDLRGYTSIADINHDMLATEIQNNDPSTEKSSFRFTLCPDTYFDGHEKLTPLLANSSFVCGRNGDSKDNCTIVGGHMQVEILPSDRVVESVDFQGITFANFTGYGVAALATKETRAEFRDCHWKDGTGESAIHIAFQSPTKDRAPRHGSHVVNREEEESNVFDTNMLFTRNHRLVEDVAESMSVLLHDCTITGSRGEHFRAVFNNRGYVRMNRVTIADNEGGILVNVVDGDSFIEDSMFVRNHVQVVLRPISDSSVFVRNSLFAENEALSTVVAKESSMLIDSCGFENNIVPMGGDLMVYSTQVNLLDSCFVGKSRNVPVFTDFDSSMQSVGVFAENGTNDDKQCNGILHGDSESTCFTGERCSGFCEPVGADACPLSSVSTATEAADSEPSTGRKIDASPNHHPLLLRSTRIGKAASHAISNT
eukprot:CAMPEP_0116824694 /NCGR_PEP_ID=MMETSP0418-20121206/1538_1 /TAXON_ID=1158023 /ORGANISM="Astrosyne radiata, Strain 13vi08-1A" /LENGTH=462 /DNA_ID=CAMNT_0004453091 /DNA_START=72 /DNA_END=1460 /DNA_ORIENTATION=-